MSRDLESVRQLLDHIARHVPVVVCRIQAGDDEVLGDRRRERRCRVGDPQIFSPHAKPDVLRPPVHPDHGRALQRSRDLDFSRTLWIRHAPGRRTREGGGTDMWMKAPTAAPSERHTRVSFLCLSLCRPTSFLNMRGPFSAISSTISFILRISSRSSSSHV